MAERFGNAENKEINEAIRNLVPVNTLKTHRSCWTQFEEFCSQRGYSLDQVLPIEELNNILKDYGFNMKKKSGEDYKKTVVKVLWNTTAKSLQEMYYNKFKFNPFKDPACREARNARDVRRRILQADVSKRKVSSAALRNEEYLKMVKLWDEETPHGLQHQFFLIVARELAWRGNEAANCLVSFFREERNNFGDLTGRLEYNPIFSKTHQGGCHSLSESKWLVPNMSSDLCPVRLFKKLLSKRSDRIKTDRMFLSVNHGWTPENKAAAWFKNCPAGINELGKWLKDSAQKAGLDTKRLKITNHSARSSAVTMLASSGIGEQELIKITGHSSGASIKPYLQLNEEHHSRLIQCFRDKAATTSEPVLAKKNEEITSTYNWLAPCFLEFKLETQYDPDA
ncbi:uncharacterized protein [Tenebrio molitor]|uniref:uncharacterized protein n=1 Tax=Tenebrio molitor TaxID=7067 RepID=UPI0036247920